MLRILGPILLTGAEEVELKSTLAEAFRNRLRDLHGQDVFHPYVRDEDFQKVKLQLRALGVISLLSEAPVGQPQGGRYWAMTPYGDSLLTMIAAIPSSKSMSGSDNTEAIG